MAKTHARTDGLQHDHEVAAAFCQTQQLVIIIIIIIICIIILECANAKTISGSHHATATLTVKATTELLSSTYPMTTSEAIINPLGERPKPTHPLVCTRTAKSILLPLTIQYSSYAGEELSRRKFPNLARRVESWAKVEHSKALSSNARNMADVWLFLKAPIPSPLRFCGWLYILHIGSPIEDDVIAIAARTCAAYQCSFLSVQ